MYNNIMILIILLLIILYYIIKYVNNITNNNIDVVKSVYSNTMYKNNYLDNDKKIKNLYSNNPILNNYKENDDYLPINISDKENPKISDIYNNSIKSYKNYKKKELIELPIIDGASNLQFINPNMWNYKDENIINGGTMEDNIYAYDELTHQTNSIF